MPVLKKEQERDELHRAIWAIADELRGSVDGWDFKSYVLDMMFYRYISEHFADRKNQDEREAWNTTFEYAALSNEYTQQYFDRFLTSAAGIRVVRVLPVFTTSALFSQHVREVDAYHKKDIRWQGGVLSVERGRTPLVEVLPRCSNARHG